MPRIPAGDAALTLLSAWRACVARFGEGTQATLRGLRLEKAGAVVRAGVTRRRFLQYLRRPSGKAQAIVAKFQAAFNEVCSCVCVYASCVCVCV